MPDLYDLLKAAHVAATILWIGGMLATALALRILGDRADPLRDGFARYARRVTAPAEGLVFALGLVMATLLGWWDAGWLYAKLALAVGLAGLNGVMAASLRKGRARPGLTSAAPWIIGGAVLLIAALVILKPF